MISSDILVFIGISLTAFVCAALFVVLRRGSTHEDEQRASKGGFGGIFRDKNQAEAACNKLFNKVWDLDQKREVINSYAPEYFNTLQDAGWQDFTAILSQLAQVQEILEGYLANRNYSDAAMLANYVSGTFNSENSRHELALARQRFPSMVGLEDWQRVTNDILTSVAVAVEQAAADTKSLGINRAARKRKPTLVMISEMVGRLHE